MKFIFFSFPHELALNPGNWLFAKALEHNHIDNCFFVGSLKNFDALKKHVPDYKNRIGSIESIENKYIIDDNIFPEFENTKEDRINFFKEIACEKFFPLINILDEHFHSITKENKIDAVFTARNCASLNFVVKKYNLPLIHLEGGPLRSPKYMRTGYFDFSGLYKYNNCLQRYSKFKSELKEHKPDIIFLEKNKLLYFAKQKSKIGTSVFPNEKKNVFKAAKRKAKANMKHVFDFLSIIFYKRKIFDVGIAMQFENDLDTFLNGGNGFDNLATIQHAKNFFDKEQILIRKHPSDKSKEIDNEVTFIDKSADVTMFFKRCKRILVIHSAVGYESLLLGKPTWIVGSGPLRLFANKNNDLNLYEPTDGLIEKLNFYLFGYSAPWDLMTNPEYVKFRLSSPTEIEIYKKHLDYWNNLN